MLITFYESKANVTVLEVVECFLRVDLNLISSLFDTGEKNSLELRLFSSDLKNRLATKVTSTVVTKPITM